ncbi:unnamed protein product [Somion occarium]|uniref:MYND-type domain-containing protein n=1 Tax=Somion occarium TaxID=3059160 RepID=A0ABP1CJA4_9APHY
MNFTATINPSPAQAMAVMQASGLNNEALQCMRTGDHAGAEHLHKQAIQVKEVGLGTDHITTALSYNALGETYVAMGRLDEAEDYLGRALRVRATQGPAMDAAVTRDNLGRVCEMRGDLAKAREIRTLDQSHVACGHYDCPAMTDFPMANLSHCSKCKSVFYCSRKCQCVDWKRHKSFCKSATA